MKEEKTIYCPKCGRKVGTYDGRSTIDHIASCKRCKKLVIYRIKTDTTEIKPLPQRKSSSGITFV